MKKTLISEIKRNLELIHGSSKTKLIMEDGLLRTIIDLLSQKLSKANRLPPEGTAKVSPGVKVGGEDGVTLMDNQKDDIELLLSVDAATRKQYASIAPEIVQKIRDIILMDENIKTQIFDSMIDDLTRELGSVAGKQFQNDVEMYDYLRRSFNNLEDIKDRVIMANPNPGEDPLIDIFYEVLAQGVYKKTKSLAKGDKVDVAFEEISDIVTDLRYWDQIPIQPLPQNVMDIISQEITPTIRQSISAFFKKFDDKQELENLYLIMKRIETEQDVDKKKMLKQYVVQKYAYIYQNKRDVWKTMDEFISKILEKNKNSTGEIKETLSKIKKAIDDKDSDVIAQLAQSDGTLRKLQKDYYDVIKLFNEPHYLNPYYTTGALIKMVKRFKTKDDALKKAITDEFETRLKNTWNMVWKGSTRGGPRNKIWMDLTDNNIPRARKLYIIEVYGRALVVKCILALLYALGKALQSIYISWQKKPELNACRAFMNNPDNIEKIKNGKLTDQELASSKCTYDILFAIRSQDRGASAAFFDELKPDLKGSLQEVLKDVGTFLIPGYWDDILNEGLKGYVATFDPETPEYTKKLIQKYKEELENEYRKNPVEQDQTSGNPQSQEEKYTNDINGFKQFLKDNPKLPAKDPQPNKNGGFSTGSFTFTWIDTNKDNKGRFELKKQDF